VGRTLLPLPVGGARACADRLGGGGPPVGHSRGGSLPRHRAPAHRCPRCCVSLRSGRMSGSDAERQAQAALDVVLQRVRDEREHGPSWLAREVARALLQAASADAADPRRRLQALRAAARAFAAVRPSMAAVANTAAALWAAAGRGTVVSPEATDDSARDGIARLRATAQRLLDGDAGGAAAQPPLLLPGRP